MTDEIQHKSLRDEVLYIIGRASAPMHSLEIYERAKMADEVEQVSKALWALNDAGKITRIDGAGRARYKLADGVAAPAPAGKAGRSKAVQADDAAAARAPLTGIRPAAEPGLPVLDIPTLGDEPGLGGQAGKTVRRAKADPVEKGLDLVESALKDSPAQVSVKEALAGKQPGADAARLADAIIARLKQSFAPIEAELEATAAPSIHIHIEQVDIHLGGL